MTAGSLRGGVLITMHRLSQGGADRVGILLANGFAAAGIPARLLLLRDGGEGEKVLRDLLDPRVSVACAGATTGSRHRELLRGLGFIRREIDTASPALVLASSNNMGLVTGLAARLGGVRRPRFAMKVTNPVVRPHDRGAIRAAYRRRLYRFVFTPYDRILTLSEAERATLSLLYPALAGKFLTTVNPYVAPEMLRASGEDRIAGGANLISLARMMPQKRLDVLLASFARVARKDARLTILGDGPLRSRLEHQARALGIADRVDMPGFAEDVLPWLRRSNLFLLSSDYEGLPAALIEALACNLPVVTTDCFDGAGALLAGADRCAVTPRGDAAALAAAIDRSLAAPGTPCGLSAIADPYGMEAAIQAHIDALRPLIDGR